jgi:hypothetical protein
MTDSTELPKYRCHKEVWALKIKEIAPGRADGKGPGQTLHFVDQRYAPRSMDELWISKNNPQEGGYWVQYKGGYESYSPADAFEEGYTLIKGG